MSEFVRVKAVKPLHDRVVRLTFTNDEVKMIDLAPLLHGLIFAEIARDRDAFLKIHVDSEAGTICWPNGADIDPDVLYLDLTPAWQEDAQASKPSEPASHD